jgi:hypothetical protein
VDANNKRFLRKKQKAGAVGEEKRIEDLVRARAKAVAVERKTNSLALSGGCVEANPSRSVTLWLTPSITL